jgi:hypothetical protein
MDTGGRWRWEAEWAKEPDAPWWVKLPAPTPIPLVGKVGVEVFPLPSKTAQPKLYRAVFLLYRLGWASTPAIWKDDEMRGEAMMLAAAVIAHARQLGISRRTMATAKALCQVEDRRVGFGPGSRIWWLAPRREFVRWVPGKRYLARLEYDSKRRQAARRSGRKRHP